MKKNFIIKGKNNYYNKKFKKNLIKKMEIFKITLD